LHRSGDVYYFPLQSGNNPAIPIASVPVELTQKQAKFLGFKVSLRLEDCLDILSKGINAKYSAENLNFFYTELVRTLGEEPRDIKDWSRKTKFFATDGTFQTASQLFYYDLRGDIPTSSHWFHAVSLNSNVLERLVSHLGIRRASSTEVQTKGKTVDNAFKAKILESLEIYLPALAILEARETSEEPSAIFGMMQTHCQNMEVYSCTEIMICGSKLSEPLFSDGSKLFIIGDIKFIEKKSVRKRIATVLSSSFRLSAKVQRSFEDMFYGLDSLEEILEAKDLSRAEYNSLRPNVRTLIHTNQEDEPSPPASPGIPDGSPHADTGEIQNGSPSTRRANRRRSPDLSAIPSGGSMPINRANSTRADSTSRQTAEIGMNGEMLVYQYYQRLHRNTEGYISDDDGFHVNEELRVDWPNKKHSKNNFTTVSTDPFDFKITNGVSVTYLEVKATDSDNPQPCQFSKREILMMFHRYPGPYKYIVCRVGPGDTMKIYEEPWSYIRDDSLLPIEISLDFDPMTGVDIADYKKV
jgi:hypothetical protein